MALKNLARLIITCEDQKGIISAVSGFFHKHGVNITALDQHSTSLEGGTLILRMEFCAESLDISRQLLERSFERSIAQRYDMKWRLSYANEKKQIALFVSQHDHAFVEMLWRWSRGELDGDIACVISNHRSLKEVTESFGIPFHEVRVLSSVKEKAEQEIMEHLNGIDLLVLARYMQVLSPGFVSKFKNRIINIHHSFLPAFAGANPYQQAHDRGVKVIGATAHYVTAELDQGPIIAQDIKRVSHKLDVEDLKMLGQDIERNVLYQAVQWHLQERIIVCGSRTVVFD